MGSGPVGSSTMEARGPAGERSATGKLVEHTTSAAKETGSHWKEQMEDQYGGTGQLDVIHRLRTERNVMISVETQSRLAGHTIIEKALRYFGPEGLGLEIAGRCGRSARFKGCTGFVSIDLEFQVGNMRTQVKAVGRGFDLQMNTFIGTI